jgi:hypothetical protein
MHLTLLGDRQVGGGLYSLFVSEKWERTPKRMRGIEHMGGMLMCQIDCRKYFLFCQANRWSAFQLEGVFCCIDMVKSYNYVWWGF